MVNCAHKMNQFCQFPLYTNFAFCFKAIDKAKMNYDYFVWKEDRLGMEHSIVFPFRTRLSVCVLESRQLPQLERLFGLLHQEGFYGVELSLH